MPQIEGVAGGSIDKGEDDHKVCELRGFDFGLNRKRQLREHKVAHSLCLIGRKEAAPRTIPPSRSAVIVHC